MNGSVLFAGCGVTAASLERILTGRHPNIHTERAASASEALTIRSVMRPEVIVMGMEYQDMTGEHLLCELKRDIVHPYLIVCTGKCSAQERCRILRMGANEVMQEPMDVMRAEELIERQLSRREEKGMGLPEAALQRMFAATGIPFDLKGYRYLRCALALLDSGEEKMEPIRSLYERIGEKYGCMPTAVERNIRYAIGLCGERMDAEYRVSNREFIALLMEQKRTGTQRMCSPKVSVFCSDRRLFRS